MLRNRFCLIGVCAWIAGCELIAPFDRDRIDDGGGIPPVGTPPVGDASAATGATNALASEEAPARESAESTNPASE